MSRRAATFAALVVAATPVVAAAGPAFAGDGRLEAHGMGLMSSDSHRVRERKRRTLRRLRRADRMTRAILPYRDWLRRLRACESSDNWRVVNSLGYAGAYQFGPWAWAAAGGRGFPADASPLEQSYRAVVLRRRYGLSQWECYVGS